MDEYNLKAQNKKKCPDFAEDNADYKTLMHQGQQVEIYRTRTKCASIPFMEDTGHM